MIFLR